MPVLHPYCLPGPLLDVELGGGEGDASPLDDDDLRDEGGDPDDVIDGVGEKS